MSKSPEPIPFGRDVKTGKVKYVKDVERGNACNCVCPACGHLLAAKLGKINRAHFAHQPRKIESIEADICKHSFYSSIRAMAIQVLQPNAELVLPDYFLKVGKAHIVHGELGIENIHIAERSSVVVSRVEQPIDKINIDGYVTVYIGSYPINILLTYPGGASLCGNVYDDRSGYLEIDLEPLKYEFYDKEGDIDRFDENYIAENIWGSYGLKNWVFHPREIRMLQSAKLTIEKRLSAFSYRRCVFRCLSCLHGWTVASSQEIECPMCGEQTDIRFDGYSK